MKKYYKNNQLVVRPKVLFHNGMTHLNPTDELLKQLGYKIEEVELENQPMKNVQNDDIDRLKDKFKSLFGRNENKNN